MSSSLNTRPIESQRSNAESEAAVDTISRTAMSGGLGAGMGLELDEAYFDISDFMADETVR